MSTTQMKKLIESIDGVTTVVQRTSTKIDTFAESLEKEFKAFIAEDEYNDYQDDELYDGCYVRVIDDGNEIFKMKGDPGNHKVRIEDKQDRGWYIYPSKLQLVSDNDPAIDNWFPLEEAYGERDARRDMEAGIQAAHPVGIKDVLVWAWKRANGELVRIFGTEKPNRETPAHFQLVQVPKGSVSESANHLGDKEYSSYAAWKAACKKANAEVWFDGDKDIGQAMIGPKPYIRGKTKAIGEWDGEVGSVYSKKQVKETAYRLNELSPKTLGSYANKATDELAAAAFQHGYEEDEEQADRVAAKRAGGIKTATNKLVRKAAPVTEGKASYVNTIYPDTKQGIIKFFSPDSGEISPEWVKQAGFPQECNIHPDPSVEGVWAVDSMKNGSRTIVYLGGYPDPWRKIRELNDFETGSLPMKMIKNMVSQNKVSKEQLANWVKANNLTPEEYTSLVSTYESASRIKATTLKEYGSETAPGAKTIPTAATPMQKAKPQAAVALPDSDPVKATTPATTNPVAPVIPTTNTAGIKDPDLSKVLPADNQVDLDKKMKDPSIQAKMKELLAKMSTN